MKKILALDDDPSILDFIRKVLDSKGYQTVTTTDCDEFFALFRAQPIDLVLLDICMPVKNGLEVFKDLCGAKHPPVLFITGDFGAFSTESKTAMELWKTEFAEGTADIIYKPFTVAALNEKIVSLIGDSGDLL